MASFSNPIPFSRYFGIDSKIINDAGFIDSFLNVDTPLFIDPILLDKSSFSEINNDAYQNFRKHFEQILRLLIISRAEGDAPWRAAQKQLSLREPPENGLGYGRGERSGTSRPEELRDTILRTAKEIVDLGARDPEMISLMGFFEENVGPDTISDFTSRVIGQNLAKITNEFCINNKIPVSKSDYISEIAGHPQ